MEGSDNCRCATCFYFILAFPQHDIVSWGFQLCESSNLAYCFIITQGILFLSNHSCVCRSFKLIRKSIFLSGTPKDNKFSFSSPGLKKFSTFFQGLFEYKRLVSSAKWYNVDD